MKRPSSNQTAAFGRIELLVVAVLVFGAISMAGLYKINKKKAHAKRMECIRQLKDVAVSFIVWSADHNAFPMQLPPDKGGTLGSAETASAQFAILTGGLRPVNLLCPADDERASGASSAATLTDARISYFVNLSATDAFPETPLSGDRNVSVNGAAAKPGVVAIAPADPVAFDGTVHSKKGNVVSTDGSVHPLDSAELHAVFSIPARLALP